MPQTPKQKPKPKEGKSDEPEKDAWSEDQKERGYYYDDAHGYETFDPDEDEKEEI